MHNKLKLPGKQVPYAGCHLPANNGIKWKEVKYFDKKCSSHKQW